MSSRYNPRTHHRRSIRLRDYDYTQAGAYFVTICAHQKECLFGKVVNNEIQLNGCGQIVSTCWNGLPHHFPNVELDEFIIMPNHVHGIIVIADRRDTRTSEAFAHANHARSSIAQANTSPPQRTPGTQQRSLGAIAQNFKSVSTRKINQLRHTPGITIWQRSYHERIIRNEQELNAIRQYIANNPLQWALDKENPDR